MKAPKYLLKFIKREHLQYFLDEGLYMNAAGYFAAKGYEENDNQNDIYEGLATFPYTKLSKGKTSVERYDEAKTEFDRLCACAPQFYNVYKGRQLPIWCCTGIEEKDILDGVFKIDNRVLRDFFRENYEEGRAVLLDCEKFLELVLKSKDEHDIKYGFVNYHNIHTSFCSFADSGNWWDSVFYKRKDLCYQKEFRIAIQANCRPNSVKVIVDHVETEMLDPQQSYQAHKHIVPDIALAVVKIFDVGQVKNDSNFLWFEIEGGI